MRLDESMLHKAAKRAFCGEGQLYNTSKANIAQGVWAKSSTME